MRFKVTETPEERFAKLYIPEPNSGCWIWTAQVSGSGYGRFWVDGRYVQAHRWRKEIELGREIPVGVEACHKCDVRPCVNPDHVFEGTRRDNAIDAWNKNRVIKPPWTIGEFNPRAILCAADIPKIRTMFAQGSRIVDIANQYDVAWSTIDNILKGRRWTHV